MANALITPDMVARMALANLYANSVMLPLVSRVYDGDFKGGIGDTVNVPKRAILTANLYNQAVGISVQDVTESTIPVKLDKVLDVSVGVTSLDYTMELQDFNDQIVAPAMEAIVGSVDASLLAMAVDISQSVTVSQYNASTAPHPTFALIDAGRTLDTKKVPDTERYAVVDPYIAAAFKKDELTTAADKVGDDGTALRRGAVAGMLHGFDVVKSNRIVNWQGLAFHRSAFAFVTAPLPRPDGAAWSQIVNFRGLSVRVVKDYNITYKKDIISFDILYGLKTMDANRAVVLNGNATSG